MYSTDGIDWRNKFDVHYWALGSKKRRVMDRGDSLGSNGYVKSTEDLFDEVDFLKKAEIDHKFMVTKFIPKVIRLFREGIISRNEAEKGGSSIVATPSRIFEIQEDYSVLEPELGMCAIGCGEEVSQLFS